MQKTPMLPFRKFISGITLLAQQTVTGKITDASGLPVAGVSVKAKKSGKIALTGSDGTFSISLPADDELEISSIGYVKQTVKTGSGPINISLVQSVEELGQVVLVGSRRAGRVKTETTSPVDVISMSQVSGLLPEWT